MEKYTLDDAISLPESAFDISQHLGFSKAAAANWAWLEIAGAALSHYLVDRHQRLQALLDWFYRDLGFCMREDYFSVEAADLGACLISRQGNSTSLATVLMLLAKQLDLQLEPLLLPGNTLLCSRIDNQVRYLDPLTGRDLSRHQLHVLVRGELGNGAQFKPGYLKPASVKRLISRMLHELKAGCIVSHQFEAAMECCNLLLQWHGDDVHLNRERAFIAQQLGCIQVAAADLRHFIDKSPHDPVIELVKLQLRELSEHRETYH
ncbi:tetratricopeptide repeat protein [Shewanella salipaludis]|uniref:Tetratricopeptide repeat protein n=1 Tax=Shewanella salipaludis TaxID=2723052 RepID=A0A972JL91_9GAMM|nr:tetratricopeptide repeat protein [Shewanella salipaludis]NMH67010.1 tetratricopeptide repeat protein [Shewanella salipaludis]